MGGQLQREKPLLIKIWETCYHGVEHREFSWWMIKPASPA